ncbi:MAG: hypothetical protein LBT40_18260 [Deltaproteobacteria bacterium]|nr:hypothetical protein [Deltaproteobacteria bacterium]
MSSAAIVGRLLQVAVTGDCISFNGSPVAKLEGLPVDALETIAESLRFIAASSLLGKFSVQPEDQAEDQTEDHREDLPAGMSKLFNFLGRLGLGKFWP